MTAAPRAGSRGCCSVRITSVPDALRPFVIVLAVAGLHLLFSSNTVTASIIIPILVALATGPAPRSVDDRRAGGIHLVTRTSSWSVKDRRRSFRIRSGYFSIRDMAKAGILMTVAAAACVAATQHTPAGR